VQRNRKSNIICTSQTKPIYCFLSSVSFAYVYRHSSIESSRKGVSSHCLRSGCSSLSDGTQPWTNLTFHLYALLVWVTIGNCSCWDLLSSDVVTASYNKSPSRSQGTNEKMVSNSIILSNSRSKRKKVSNSIILSNNRSKQPTGISRWCERIFLAFDCFLQKI
jgi:hypothetical protein